MPNKPHSSDWERYFGRNAPRRRGPLGLFVILTLVLGFLSISAIGAGYGVERYQAHVVAQGLTATPLWEKYYADQTATALARVPPPATVLITKVVSAGNLRSEPRIVPQTVIGQVAVGDAVTVLESRTVAERLWYRVRLADQAGREGWVSSTLVAPPAP